VKQSAYGDQDGEVIDVYLQAKRDGVAAKHFSNDYFGQTVESLGGL